MRDLSTGNWTDLADALSTGSWVTTFSDVGSLVVETVFQDARVTAIGRELMGGGGVRTSWTGLEYRWKRERC